MINFDLLARGISLNEIVRQACNSVRASTDSITCAQDGVLGGDFSEFNFPENPANAVEKRLSISGMGYFEQCRLINTGTMEVPGLIKSVFDSFSPRVLGEAAPYFYDETITELNQIKNLGMPAIIMPRPQRENIGYGMGISLTRKVDLVLLFADFVEPLQWRADLESVYYGGSDEYLQKIESNLAVYLRRFIRNIEGTYMFGPYSEAAATVIFPDKTNICDYVFYRRFKDSAEFADSGLDANLGGFVVKLQLVIENSDCILK